MQKKSFHNYGVFTNNQGLRCLSHCSFSFLLLPVHSKSPSKGGVIPELITIPGIGSCVTSLSEKRFGLLISILKLMSPTFI